MFKTVFLLMFTVLLAQNETFNDAVSFYNKRSEDSIGKVPNDTNITNAINIFESFLNTDKDLESAGYLVRSYYFMAQYVSQEYSDKMLYFELAKTLSEQYIYKYPNSVEMLYCNLANMSNWARAVGVRAVSKLGAADEYRERAVDIIILDPEYEDGGGLFLLGAVYYTAPYIPIILNWPDNDKAIKYLSKAVNTGNATPLQVVYLVRALIDGEELDRAEYLLFELVNTDPRPENYIEDLHYISDAKALWDEHYQ